MDVDWHPHEPQRPGLQARGGRAASLGALPNAFTTHCVLGLCWPSTTRAPASRAPHLPEQQPCGAVWPAQERRQSQAGALRSGSAASRESLIPTPGFAPALRSACSLQGWFLLVAGLSSTEIPSRPLLEPSSRPLCSFFHGTSHHKLIFF